MKGKGKAYTSPTTTLASSDCITFLIHNDLGKKPWCPGSNLVRGEGHKPCTLQEVLHSTLWITSYKKFFASGASGLKCVVARVFELLYCCLLPSLPHDCIKSCCSRFIPNRAVIASVSSRKARWDVSAALQDEEAFLHLPLPLFCASLYENTLLFSQRDKRERWRIEKRQ